MSSEKRDTRARILRAAVELLESGTGGAVRMSDIAKTAGISRQAVYLHFPKRADLLIAATRYLDEKNDVDARLEKSRTAQTGVERLDAWVEVWGNYIPEIYGIGKALMAMMDSDEEARAAWDDRMQAVRHGCAAAVRDLARDGQLAPRLSEAKATDLLWTLLSVRNWAQLRHECGWTQEEYVTHMKGLARVSLCKAKS
ncbi:TetR/AcrR family transcriptional regulator [Maritalea mediterranea]|uniref:TetR/AcrR family transcriptional regulator n=1 Tax=Maritalea mediterranea TaxID=2909667 RepID=A0ABS9E7Y3_9HYPH|nr:TetR/AcrR family transcriptional regulator [Maritalea mediterranea]MCF4098990.1 TetR/AcrR family transcriptional regulator [Maritalea mediterranea]